MRKLSTLALFFILAFLKTQAQTCFAKNWTGSGVDQMNFYILKATVNNIDLQIGDEIGIFDGMACVGVGVLTQGPLGGTVYLSIVASNDDVSTPAKDGFTPNNVISYKLCIHGGNTVVTVVGANYTLGTSIFTPGGTVGVELAGIIDIPDAPIVGLISQPACTVSTGSVVLSGLPATRNWTLTRSPGSITTIGSGTSTTITGLTASETYTYTVTNSSGVTSASSANVVINAPQAIPTVSTRVISNASVSTATGGGEITQDGGAVVTVSGVCWSTAINPTTGDSKSSDGSTIGSYSSTLSGLTNGVTYHVRAYATNCVGTAYGADIVYTHTFTGIESIQAAGIVVYPNPVSGTLNIKYIIDNFITIRILNSLGMLIGREIAVPPQQPLDFSEFEPGLYILEFVKHNGEVVRIKLLKNY